MDQIIKAPAELYGAAARLVGIDPAKLEQRWLPPARTVFLTDNKKFFIKWVENPTPPEAAGALYAQANGIHTPKLLSAGVFQGKPLLVFEYLPRSLEPCLNPLPLLQRIWALPGEPTFPKADIASRRLLPLKRLATHSTPYLKELKALYSLFEKEEARLINGRKLPQTWIHGDCHERNLFCYGGEPMALDWEWHAVGYREIDAGKWLQGCLSESEHEDPSAFWEALKKTDLDLELVLLVMRQAAANSYTYQLQWRTKTEWMERLLSLARGEHPKFSSLT